MMYLGEQKVNFFIIIKNYKEINLNQDWLKEKKINKKKTFEKKNFGFQDLGCYKIQFWLIS